MFQVFIGSSCLFLKILDGSYFWKFKMFICESLRCLFLKILNISSCLCSKSLLVLDVYFWQFRKVRDVFLWQAPVIGVLEVFVATGWPLGHGLVVVHHAPDGGARSALKFEPNYFLSIICNFYFRLIFFYEAIIIRIILSYYSKYSLLWWVHCNTSY